MFKLLVVAISYLVANSNGLNENEDSIIYDPTAPKPCSNNATSAYVDILLVIDTSSNMGNANLRKIGTTLSLILPKFTIGQQSDITQGYRNTRVGVITYDSNVKIIANYTDINSVLDVSKILNGLTASNDHATNIGGALFTALGIVNPCSETDDPNCIQLPYSRPTAIILFAAKAAVDDLGDNLGGIQDTLVFLANNDATLITVNFNNADPILTGVLDIITYNKFAGVSMYNFVSTRSSLTKDFEWAILQANCYCEQANNLFTSVKVQFDSTTNRYSRYRECLWVGPRTVDQNPPVSTVEICDYLPIQSVPANILSADENKFFEAMILDSHIDGGGYIPSYFGLHKNKQSQWVYYGYNLTEFPMSNYTNWAPGYPKPNDKCAILDSIDSKHENLVWKSIGCDPSAQNFNYIWSICQFEGCDSTTLDCCYACAVENQGGFEGKVKKMKRRSERKIKNSKGRFNRLINKN